MDLIIVRLVFFLPLLLILQQVAQPSVAIEIDGENWSKTTTLDGQVITNDQIHRDGRSKLSNAAGSNIPGAASVLKEEANVLRLRSMDMDFQEKNCRERIIHEELEPGVHYHQHLHMNHNSPPHVSCLVFFNLDDLEIGKTMLVYFPVTVLSFSKFLPKETAEEIPFSSKQLPRILQHFSLPQGSPQATEMENTLSICEQKPVKGETKLCATSMDSMFDFARSIFGSTVHNKFQLLSTIHTTNLTAELQKYTIIDVPKEYSASKVVACHPLNYPYGILFCHHVENSKAYRVHLLSEHGDEIEAIAVCHMDTSQWSRNDISFRVLGVEPRSQPVCHFLSADNIVLLPSTSS